jgi:hypothetical protein
MVARDGQADPGTCPHCGVVLSEPLGPLPLPEDDEAWMAFIHEHAATCEYIVGRRRHGRHREQEDDHEQTST